MVINSDQQHQEPRPQSPGISFLHRETTSPSTLLRAPASLTAVSLRAAPSRRERPPPPPPSSPERTRAFLPPLSSNSAYLHWQLSLSLSHSPLSLSLSLSLLTLSLSHTHAHALSRPCARAAVSTSAVQPPPARRRSTEHRAGEYIRVSAPASERLTQIFAWASHRFEAGQHINECLNK